MVVAASLRPALTSLPPLIDSIRSDLGLSLAAISLLTAIPLICFGVAAPLGISPQARSRSPEIVIFFFLVLLTLALAMRVLAGWPLLFAGTVIVGVAIAALNVLVPVVIKRDFPSKITTIMPVYTSVLAIAATLSAALSVPISNATTRDWRGGIGFFAIPGLLAIALWAPVVYHRRNDTIPSHEGHAQINRALRRDPIAWSVTLFFGIQSAAFYSVVAWLPKTFIDAGYSAASAGGMLAVSTAISVPSSLILPLLFGRGLDQRRMVAITTSLTIMGFLGMSIAPMSAPILWVIFLGLGQASFPTSLVIMTLRARSTAETAPLSSMTQGIGYLIAALGPIALGFIHQYLGGWRAPYVLLLVLVVVQMALGLKAGKPREGEIDHRELANA